MRTTLNLEDKLIKDLLVTTGTKSKTKAITIAVTDYLRRKNIAKLISLQGKVNIEYDWQAEEELELAEYKND